MQCLLEPSWETDGEGEGETEISLLENHVLRVYDCCWVLDICPSNTFSRNVSESGKHLFSTRKNNYRFLPLSESWNYCHLAFTQDLNLTHWKKSKDFHFYEKSYYQIITWVFHKSEMPAVTWSQGFSLLYAISAYQKFHRNGLLSDIGANLYFAQKKL